MTREADGRAKPCCDATHRFGDLCAASNPRGSARTGTAP
ncbi:hypothetical protein LC55x_4064 [Lysobacter capsici]|nr:hypothetical protein LC55x_4064 [Lysobacter capsici]